jgi:hypothetical protein
MTKEKFPELQKLSPAGKALAVELWDDLTYDPDELPFTEE